MRISLGHHEDIMRIIWGHWGYIIGGLECGRLGVDRGENWDLKSRRRSGCVSWICPRVFDMVQNFHITSYCTMKYEIGFNSHITSPFHFVISLDCENHDLYHKKFGLFKKYLVHPILGLWIARAKPTGEMKAVIHHSDKILLT